MLIPERYMVTAERVDNRERVKGYYKTNGNFHCVWFEGCGFSYGIEIDPKTIEPVAVKPIYGGDEIHKTAKCRNCKCDLTTLSWDSKQIPDTSKKYCSECGQRIDWSDT